MSETTEAPETVTVPTSKLLDIYLDGFISGAGSAVRYVGMPAEMADRLAQNMTNTLYHDANGMAAIGREIDERLAGIMGTHRIVPVGREKSS